jgi:hypothetical protein
MERSGMLKPTCTVPVPRHRTKLRNEFELAHDTPQLNKHVVMGRAVSSDCCIIIKSLSLVKVGIFK